MTTLRLTASGRDIHLRPGESAIIGRDLNCDVTLSTDGTSRRHARISDEEGWRLVDLGSANGTRVNGVPVLGTHELHDGDVIHLGSPDSAATVVVHLLRAGGTGGPPALGEPLRRSTPSGVRTIGRAADCDVVVGDLNASRRHARVSQRPGSPDWHIEDLGSFNGTFVNGQRIGRGRLVAGDLVTIGTTTFELRTDGQFVDLSSAGAPALVVSDLTVTLQSGQRLLDSVSFSVRPNSLTAVIGPSGAGKSTLFKAMTGAISPTVGTVTYDGVDVHAHLPSLRGRVGVVPQDDVLHTQLSVRRVLSYAAELRFPPDVPVGARRARVDETIRELGLSEHAATRVDRLSGGQRKRTSVALELLTRPSLLLLDEPTSGLDAGLDLALMTTLRGLAQDGRTVLVITHSNENLTVCDDVLMLGPGGQVVYLGPPDELLASVGAGRYAEAFTLVSDRTPDPARRGGVRRGWHRWDAGHPAPDAGSLPALSSAVQARVRDQLGPLLRRTVRLVAVDRSHLRFVALMPLVLAALALAVPGGAGFGPASPPTTEAMNLLVVLVMGATFMGLSLSVRELVRERAIFERERDAGMSPMAYLLAKVVVLGAMAVGQSVVMGVAVLAFRPGPASSVGPAPAWFELLLALAMTAVVAVAVGLAASALVSTSEQVMPILVSAVMAQLVLCGGMVPIVGRAGLEQLALLAPARWGYAAAAGVVDVDRISVRGGDDPLWRHDLATNAGDLLALILLGVIACVVVHRRNRVRAPSAAVAGRRLG